MKMKARGGGITNQLRNDRRSLSTHSFTWLLTMQARGHSSFTIQWGATGFSFSFFYCGLQQLSADAAGETLLGLLLIARLSNGTERINAAEHQRLRLCDTYLIKSYWLEQTHGAFCAHRDNDCKDLWKILQGRGHSAFPLSHIHTNTHTHTHEGMNSLTGECV